MTSTNMTRGQAPDLPKLVHHRATGRARFRHRGKDIYVGPWDAKRDRPAPEAVANARYEWKRIVEGTHPKFISAKRSSVATIRQAAMAFVEDLGARGKYRRADGTETSEPHLIQQALRRLVQAHGDVRCQDYSTAHLRALQRTFVKPVAKYASANGGQQKRAKPLSTRTANAYTQRIMRMFKWAELEGYAPEGTHGKLSLVPMLEQGEYSSQKSEPREPVSPADLRAVLRYLRSDGCRSADAERTELLIRVAVATGARISELLHLRRCDVIEKGGERFFSPAQHKNSHRGQERVVWIPKRAWELLEPFLPLDARAYVWHVEGKARRAMSYAGARDRLRVAIKRAGCKAWTWHQLRHSRATQLAERYGLETAGVLLGHKGASTPAGLVVTAGYVHRQVEKVVAELPLRRVRVGA